MSVGEHRMLGNGIFGYANMRKTPKVIKHIFVVRETLRWNALQNILSII